MHVQMPHFAICGFAQQGDGTGQGGQDYPQILLRARTRGKVAFYARLDVSLDARPFLSVCYLQVARFCSPLEKLQSVPAQAMQ